MKLSFKLTIWTLSLLILSSNSASAQSCRDVKSSYDRQMEKYKSELSQFNKEMVIFNSPSAKAERNRLAKENAKKRRECLKQAKLDNRKRDGLTAEERCRIDSLNAALQNYGLTTPSRSSYQGSLDIAQRIVLNNKKCFDPVLVAEVQISRG